VEEWRKAKIVQFETRFTKGPEGWIWTGYVTPGGYGEYNRQLAHRVAYELYIGPIPEGYEVDHVKELCGPNTLCVKALADEYGPAHLEAVTPEENARRRRTDTCRYGHDIRVVGRTPDGTCRACKRKTRSMLDRRT
jgi:hypothetical protein